MIVLNFCCFNKVSLVIFFKVYSQDSNISVVANEGVAVVSSDSLIELTETHFNSSIWSAASHLLIDSAAGNITVKNSFSTILKMHLKSAQLNAAANQFKVNFYIILINLQKMINTLIKKSKKFWLIVIYYNFPSFKLLFKSFRKQANLFLF